MSQSPLKLLSDGLIVMGDVIQQRPHDLPPASFSSGHVMDRRGRRGIVELQGWKGRGRRCTTGAFGGGAVLQWVVGAGGGARTLKMITL